MKNIKFRKLLITFLVCLLTVMVVLPAGTASAVSEKTDEIGYETYTYWYEFTGKGSRKAVYSKPMYEVSTVLTEADLDCVDASAINDVHVSKNGLTYLLDGGSSRVLVLDKSYNVVKVYNQVVDQDDNLYTFYKAKGIFVDDDGYIYISDTNNARVIKFNTDGKLVRMYTLPDSHLIPTGFNFKPIKTAVDRDGYVYILSDGSYYGAILYSAEDEFMGFYGSNDVPATLGQALATLWRRLFSNNTKRGSMVSALPYTFTDLWIDDQGFVYTATGGGQEVAQIKRLNPGGSNVLGSDDVNFNDEGQGISKLTGIRAQNLMGVVADEKGFSYVLDATFGRVMIYDSDCTMLSAFGGGVKAGDQKGTFYTPSAIAYNKETEDIIISDSFANTISVFKITDYGRMVKSAQAKTLVGDYEEAMDEWIEIMSLDRNCQLAYAGLAKAYYVKAQNATDEATASMYTDKAIELAEQGFDRDTYSLAFGRVRTKFIRENFTWIMLIVVALVGVVIFLLVYSTKHSMRLIKNEKAHLATTLVTHPFENFREIKEKGLTSIPICLIIIALYYVFSVMETTMGGFAFVYFDPASYNALLILAKTVGIVLLWTVVNWAVCTLMGGKGKMKEIFTVVSYSLIPSLLGSIIYVVVSNVLVPSEAAFMNILLLICTGYTLILIAIGSMAVHDYSFGKFVGTALVTLFGCAIVIFLLIAIIILLQQAWGFLVTIYTEILKLF